MRHLAFAELHMTRQHSNCGIHRTLPSRFRQVFPQLRQLQDSSILRRIAVRQILPKFLGDSDIRFLLDRVDFATSLPPPVRKPLL